MAVIIQNISEIYGKEYGKGKQIYELHINRNKLAVFTHNFEDGLAVCLRKAAEALEKAEGGDSGINIEQLLQDVKDFQEAYFHYEVEDEKDEPSDQWLDTMHDLDEATAKLLKWEL